ncbi:MAG: PDZ domain-containing protein [Acidobacteria bacterium]|nr:PDZ domain-containing protein [Acidobacteriota bacterium]MBV9623506.1 PDZ domain-containing protein [Acidobacteriota bacterium]
MSTKIKTTILGVSAGILLFSLMGGISGVRASGDGAYRQLEVYSEVLSRVRSEYVEEPNLPAVTDGALHGLLESLDSDSSYLNPEQYKEYKAHKSSAKGEIGATVSKRFGYASVVSVIPGGPADKAGLQDTDIIEAIETKSTREMSLAEIHSQLAGETGSTVSLSVVRARRAEPQKVVVTREVISVPPAQEKMLEDGIGKIQVDALTKGKSQEIASKIKALQKAGAKKLILDLRDCAQGEEPEGVATANLFLNHGTITYLQGQKYPREAFNAEPSKAITSLPVIVLVNKGTAGAAEIVAAAILENARGDVVGDKTFGEGSVQKLIELPDGSALILSIAKYYSPQGKAIQDSAVTPNVMVADTSEAAPVPDEDENAAPPEIEKKAAPEHDEQLQKAIEILRSRQG